MGLGGWQVHGGEGDYLSRSVLVHTFSTDQVQVSIFYVVHILGKLKLDHTDHFLPDLTFPNAYTVQHLC